MWNLLHETEATLASGRRPRGLCAGTLLLAAGLFVAGFLLGWFIKSSNEATNIVPQHDMKKAFLDELKAENIKKFLYNFTRIPHLAGTEQNFQLAKQIQSQWEEFGLDSVELAHYDVLLSYPNKTHPNYISIIDEDGNEISNTSLFEPPPPGYENVSDVVPPFSAFSPQGTPEVNVQEIKQKEPLGATHPAVIMGRVKGFLMQSNSPFTTFKELEFLHKEKKY